MADLTAQQVADATGAPIANVGLTWPLIIAALSEFKINTPHVQVAVAATIAVESASFLPAIEKKADENRRPALWKLQSRYWSSGYYGRGYIQLTWKANYEHYGDILGIPLAETPGLASTSAIAARILALYFKENHADTAANNNDWTRVRMIVNGGLVGWDKFIDVVHKLTQ